MKNKKIEKRICEFFDNHQLFARICGCAILITMFVLVAYIEGM